MRAISLVVLIFAVGFVVAQHRITNIYSDTACSDANLIGVVGEVNVSFVKNQMIKERISSIYLIRGGIDRNLNRTLALQ